MNKEIEKAQSPEEKELQAKLIELSSLENNLAQEELDLATLIAELQSLESRYARIVGAKFLELDRIRAEIAEILAEQQPDDVEAQSGAQQARARAEETARETGDVSEPRKVEAFKPTKELKDLYRNIAKKIHPDLAMDEKDQERRTKVMAEVNQAYKDGDVERLEAILRDWESSPESIEGEDVGARLVRTIRMIARVEQRIAEISNEMQDLMASDIHGLKIKADEAAAQGRDLFHEMVEKIEREILAAKKILSDLRS